MTLRSTKDVISLLGSSWISVQRMLMGLAVTVLLASIYTKRRLATVSESLTHAYTVEKLDAVWH
jgi:hypothetical protein